MDLLLEQKEKQNEWWQKIQTATEETLAVIHGWKIDYCLIAPITGQVVFTNYWHENQFVEYGEELCAIVPEMKKQLIGKARLPVGRSGKVRVGQRVIVRFANYPNEEFGSVEGYVSTVSLVPAENDYVLEISFPNGLTTNYDCQLPVLLEMPATAEIITDDLRLIERLTLPVKKIMIENFE